MMFSIYVPLGIFLLQAVRNMVARDELAGVALLVLIGVALIALAPANEGAERSSSALRSL